MSGQEEYNRLSHMSVFLVYGLLAVMAGGILVIFFQWIYQRFIRKEPPPVYTEKPRFFKKD
ncbi:MAG: hypothetical protein M0Z37_06045 [Nitrospiraceae bacterium]|nr:hypothetical protein [Nitrospiraceae bacterium]